MATHIGSLSARKRQLLTRLLQREPGPAGRREPIPRRPSGDAAPLSFAQQRLWLVDRILPDTALYNIGTAVRVDGALDVAALMQSFTAIAARHEILRTRIVTREGRAVQVVDAPSPVPIRVVDLSDLLVTARTTAGESVVAAECRRPFNLAAGPVFRITLVRMTGEQHILIVVMHHIVSDGWSMTIVVREMSELYEAHRLNRAVALPPLSIQYADFAAWQRESHTESMLEASLAYWSRQLADLPVVDVPATRRRPRTQSARGRTCTGFSTPSAALAALAEREGATLFMVLVAALNLVLHRYTGQTDLVIGTDVAGRNRSDLEHLIGFFVNQLVLRTDLSGRPSFRELLARVREITLAAHAHQDVPFERLVAGSGAERDVAWAPLFRIKLVLQNLPDDRADVSGLRFTRLHVDNQTAKYDLLFNLVEKGDAVTGSVEYSTDLFDEPDVRRTLGHFDAVLKQIAHDPDRMVGDFSLLTVAERQQVTVEWNDTLASASPRLVHERIEDQAAATPDAIAVIGDDAHLTYAELERRATRLASHLQRAGVGPECRVALFMERSPDLLIAILGVLEAGGAFVPCDTAYPRARLERMLDDCRPTVLLTTERWWARAPEGAYRRLSVEACRGAGSVEMTHRMPAGSANAAYVIYTSGSTGRPKGVVVEHRGLINYLTWCTEHYAVSECDGSLVHSSIAFDLTVTSLFAPLLVGGPVTLLSDDRALESVYQPRSAGEHGGLLKVTPAHLAALGRVATTRAAALTRALIVGGEALSAEALAPWRDGGEGPEIYNEYGPTETVVGSTCYRVPRDASHNGSIPIGRPIANTSVYVLDRRFHPVPIGAIGEVYIGGRGVARGYLNRAEETAERFVPNPFAVTAGDRLYKTGDLARRLPSGVLDYVGRTDQQIKLRSFRVELSEIEAVLSEHAGVRHAVVLAREDIPGHKQLVAYVAVGAGHADTPTVEDLRRFAGERLPQYMCPAAFVRLRELPLTVNGKVDRAALPAPAASIASTPPAVAVAPTSTEELLTALCADLLGVERVSLDAGFFESGGDSLLATVLISRICDAFQIALSLRVIFDTPKLRSIASQIDAACREARGVTMPPVVAGPRPERVPLTSAQRRLWFLEQLSPASAAYVCPVAVRLTGPLDATALRAAIAGLVQRHEILRTTFTAIDGEPAQVIASGQDVGLRVIDLTTMVDDQRDRALARVVDRELSRPFDLVQGPLVRAALVATAERSHVLLLSLHHMVCDAWSIGVLVRELAAIYRAVRLSVPASLNALPIQYADFALWQQAWATRERLEPQLAYWSKQLEGLAAPALPTDRTRPAIQSHRGEKVPFALSPTVSAGLAALGRTQASTMFMTLLAVFQALLRRYTSQDDCAVACPISNRRHAETEPLIGLFLNLLVIRTRVPARDGFGALLGSVRHAAIDAYVHQDVPFEQIVERLRLERDLSRNPLMQVMFAFQNTPAAVVKLPDLELTPLEIGAASTRADLELYTWESDGQVSGTFCFNPDLFDRVTIERAAQHFETIAASVVAAPASRLSELPLLTAAERHQIGVEWNDTRHAPPADGVVTRMFAARVVQQPDAIAATVDHDQLSYGALDERANRLAHYLLDHGVGAESAVGICLERTLDLIVAVLGVLKAGAMYVPLDPGFPPERLTFMAEDAALAVVLTDRACRPLVPTSRALIVCLDAEWNAIARARADAIDGTVMPAQAAYQMYTSGSTGRPRGVQVCHGGLANVLASMSVEPGFAGDDVLLAVTSLSFDIATLELLLPLVQGGRVCLVSRECAADGNQLLHALATSQATVMQATPMTWRLLVDAGWSGGQRLRVWCGGDTLTEVLAAQLVARAPVVWNLYGPTETTIWSAVHSYRSGTAGYVVGRPIHNTEIYLLDAAYQPTPIGVTGALYIAGAGLARGYANRPDHTAQQFLPSPFSREPGARLYKTGDLAKYTIDGSIEFLGRADHQIKLRGHRIELGEIEATLRRHPSVRDALALVHQDERRGTELVGYVVAGLPPPNARQLRDFTKRLLPEYMIPGAFVVLGEWPLTANGKIDRRALAALDRAPLPAETASAPRDAVEALMAEIWTSVLGVQRVDVHADFFELGGHSLLATQLLARVREVFQIDLALRDLFEEPTVARLTQRLAATDQDQVARIARIYEDVQSMPLEDVGVALDHRSG